jgi:hypothetical protein
LLHHYGEDHLIHCHHHRHRFQITEKTISSIAIITDTDSSLPDEVAARYDIRHCCTTVAAQTAGAHYRPLWDGCIGASVDREGKVVGER